MDAVQRPSSSSGPAPSSSTEPQADFVASSTFTGARQGYYFTKGSQGLGYYRDKAPAADAAKSAAAEKGSAPAKKAFLMANKSIVKGLQRKPAAALDAKKRKPEDADSKGAKYLQEMARYAAQSCNESSKGPRPLVK